jgi:chromosome partitioning protein
MILALLSQKGGVGKSALARLIAVEFVKAGWGVKIADLDAAQGTATKWKSRRDRAGLTPDIAVEKFRTVERALAEASRFDLLILDGPAHAERGGVIMARSSDLVLMPTCYSLDDMEAQVEAAYELEEAGIGPDRVCFVFCRAQGSPTEDREARAYLTKARVSVLEPVFPELACIRQGHAEGRAASEVPFKSVQDKVGALVEAVADRLGARPEEAAA